MTKWILMALDSNYSVLQTPANGVVIDTFDVLTYRPNAGFEGEDKVIFEDPNNNRIRFSKSKLSDQHLMKVSS
ncbi:MAG: hypothetical protein R2788_22810 [Saprospiraceae bacterium]